MTLLLKQGSPDWGFNKRERMASLLQESHFWCSLEEKRKADKNGILIYHNNILLNSVY